MPRVRDIASTLDRLYPTGLAEDWDRVGISVGSGDSPARGVAVALEATIETVAAARDAGADVLVTHHPLLFKPAARIDPAEPVGAVIVAAIKSDVALIAAHTNADWAVGGLNDRLAAVMGLSDVRPLDAKTPREQIKLVTFIPRDHVQAVSMAMFEAGAGTIGDYSCCSFRLDGNGTFFPEAGANPYSGSVGELAVEPETRVEVLVERARLSAVTEAMIAAHPYEEVAYDVYPVLANPRGAGVGRVGNFAEPTTARTVAAQLRQALDLPSITGAGPLDKPVTRAVLCTGGGAFLVSRAARLDDAVFITGDVRYHDARDAEQRGLPLLDIGHFGSEIGFIDITAGALAAEFAKEGWDVPVVPIRVERDPLKRL